MKKITLIILLAGFLFIAVFLLFSNQSYQTVLLSDTLLLGDGFQKYTNEKYSFSLEYPKDYGIEIFQEKEEAETIVFQGEEQEGFQIFITPFAETQLTRERILQDVPNIILDDVQEIIIGTAVGQNIPALIFWSQDYLIGKTREVWFVYGDYLYEITTYEKMDSLIAGIMSTFAIINN